MKIRDYVLIVLLALSLIQSGCTGKGLKEPSEEQIPVKVEAIFSTEIGTQRNYIGTVEESTGTMLSFQVPGNVERILVSEGSKVKQGQLLAILDKSRLQNAYQAARSQLNQAQDAFDRMKVLFNNKSLPEIKFIETQTILEQAKAAESVAKKDLTDCNLYAPFSGVVGSRFVEQGSNVAAGIPVLSVLNIEKIKVKIFVPEKEMAKIQIGDKADVFIKAFNKNYSGKIIEKGIVANPLSKAYDIKVELLNSSTELLPGMGCEVRFENKNLTAYILPLSVIQISADNQRYVWIANEDNTVRRQPVTVGDLTANGIVILDGVTNGDKVITEGFQKIYEGSKVTIQ